MSLNNTSYPLFSTQSGSAESNQSRHGLKSVDWDSNNQNKPILSMELKRVAVKISTK